MIFVANNFVYLTLDTTAPSGLQLLIDNGATFTADQFVDLALTSPEADTFEMKIFGDLDLVQAQADGLINGTATTTTEADALWIPFATAKTVKVATGDGDKTISFKVRDDVYNESTVASDVITLDTTRPTVTIDTTGTRTKLSLNEGFNESVFKFTSDTVFVEYKVKVVSAESATEDTGTTIPTTNGSVNTSGIKNDGSVFDTSVTPLEIRINSADLQLASAGDGEKLVKIFVKDEAGNWSL